MPVRILDEDGPQTHGTLSWKSATPRRSVLFKYAGTGKVALRVDADGTVRLDE